MSTATTALPQSPTAMAHSGAEEALANLITQVSPTGGHHALPTAAEIEAARRDMAQVNSPVTAATPPTTSDKESRPASRAPSTTGTSSVTQPGRTSKRSIRSWFSFLFCCTTSGGRRRRYKEGRRRPDVAATDSRRESTHGMVDKPSVVSTPPVNTNVVAQQAVVSPSKELVPVTPTATTGQTDSTVTPEPEPVPYLLPPILPEHAGRKCLVLDLDETLVHSSFKMIPQADFVVPVEIENQIHNVYVLKRPGVDEFMRRMGEHFEIVVFTASLAKYADPVLDLLDKHKVVHHRLFRESCYNYKGNYVKDLSQLGRDLRHTIIIDNSPASYILHPTNAVPITSWFNDPHDTELLDMIPFLEDLKDVDDVTLVLDSANDEDT